MIPIGRLQSACVRDTCNGGELTWHFRKLFDQRAEEGLLSASK